MDLGLQGKVVLVTGASRGIGAAIADSLAAQGAIVIGTATSDAQAAKINERLSAHGGAGRVLNVGEFESIETLIADISKEFGTIEVLVNNAGVTRDNLLMRMKDEEWDDIMHINLKSVYRASKAVLRGMMKARNGRIISIASVVGAMGNAGQANYAAAKAGVAGMTRALARELGSRNITVNCVAPGFIETDMTASLQADQQKALLNQIPLGHLGKPADIAHAVLYLASPEASYVTGQELNVNGGMYMS